MAGAEDDQVGPGDTVVSIASVGAEGLRARLPIDAGQRHDPFQQARLKHST